MEFGRHLSDLVAWQALPQGRFLFNKTDFVVVQHREDHRPQKFHFQERLDRSNEFVSEVLCKGLPLEQVAEPAIVSLTVPIKFERDHQGFKVRFRTYILNQEEQRFQVMNPKIYNERAKKFDDLAEFLEFVESRGIDLKVYQTNTDSFRLVVSKDTTSIGVKSLAVVDLDFFD